MKILGIALLVLLIGIGCVAAFKHYRSVTLGKPSIEQKNRVRLIKQFCRENEGKSFRKETAYNLKLAL